MTRENLASEQLYEEYGERISRYCMTRLRSREEAEDAAQNTFLRVHQALRQGQTPRCEEAWLYTIARNVCLSRSAAARRRAAVELAEDPDRIESELPDREYRGDQLLGLTDALGRLPANLRTAILLREWQGLSHVEIARAMDTTVPAVETLIVRARKRLAEALDRAGSAAGPLVGFAGRLQGALFGGGPAKLLAGGALLLAAGGAGLGTGVVATPGPAPSPSSPTLTQTQPRRSAVSIQPTSVLAGMPTPARLRVDPATRIAIEPARPAPAAPARATDARATDRPSTATPTTPPAPQPLTSATSAMPAAPTPTVPLPSVAVPTVPTDATLPSSSVPSVTVALPPATVPGVVTVSVPARS